LGWWFSAVEKFIITILWSAADAFLPDLGVEWAFSFDPL